MKFTKKQIEMLKIAIREYEENHYSSEDDKWQVVVNNLIEKLKSL
jgi:hypothetical protein